jgi:Na+-driven multidrug efflux pump
MPSSGINQGAQALLSYNYGSKNYERVMQTSKALLRFQFILNPQNRTRQVLYKTA